MLNKVFTWLGGIFLVSIFPILYFSTNSAGKDDFLDLAVEYEICTDADSCTQEQTGLLAEIIIEETAYTSLQQIHWCLGVDSWADTRVRKGGWLVGIMMEGGYLFCPSAS